jgi:hypothetical protein
VGRCDRLRALIAARYDHDAHELVLSDLPEAALIGELRGLFRFGVVLSLAGATLGALAWFT